MPAGQRVLHQLTAAAVVMGVALTASTFATPAAEAAGTVFEVTNTDDSGPGSLREALAQAEMEPSDDQITFAPAVTGTIALTSGQLDVTVGGAAGSLTIGGPGTDALTIDAGGRSRVLDVHGPGGDVRPSMGVSGLTLTRGRALQGGDAQGNGGAVRATGTDVTLDHVRVADSYTDIGSGGGVSVEGGSLVVTSSNIIGNHASPDLGSAGGGIYVDGGGAAGAALTVHDSTISDNAAGWGGGGICSRSPVTLTGSTVSGNVASSTWRGMEAAIVEGTGGGLLADGVTVVDSAIEANEAGVHGGGLAGRNVVVTRSTISDNAARLDGGGVYAGQIAGWSDADYALRVDSSTLTGNRARDGGGVRVASDMPLEVNLSTVAANAAVTGGGLSSTAGAVLRGSIVAMNAGGDLAADASTTLDRSWVQDPRGSAYVDSGGSILGEDPRLGALGDNGGQTATLLPGSNSGVIDRGDSFGALTDQRESSRPVDDPDVADATDGSDIGAAELTPSELAGPLQVGSTTRPTVAGTVRVGETLHTYGGTWEPAGPSLSYQWLRDGLPIPGATEASYTLTADDYDRNWYGEDLRKRVSVRVTATAPGYRAASAVSDYTGFVTRGILETSRRARVAGKLEVGSTLRARPHVRAVSPRPTGVGIRWFLDDRRVAGADGHRRFELEPRMRGKEVKVRFRYSPPRGYRALTKVVHRRHAVR